MSYMSKRNYEIVMVSIESFYMGLKYDSVEGIFRLRINAMIV